jgi:hypothetical protein
MRALRVCTDTKAAAPASAKCVERVAPIFGMARDKCLPKLQDEFQCGNTRWTPQSAKGCR